MCENINISNVKDVENVLEYLIDQRLKYSWSVGEFIGHNQVFVVALGGVKDCFPFVSLPNKDEIICAL